MSESAKGNSTRENYLSLEQWIDYLEGRLSPSEQRKVAAMIQEHELYREGTEGLSTITDRERLRQTVAQLNQHIEALSSGLPRRRKHWKMWYSAAAILLLLLLPTIYLLLPSGSKSPFELFFDPYPNIIPLVRGDSTLNTLENAMIRYEQDDFQGALAILREIPRESPQYTTARFYSGISNLSLGQGDSAVVALREVLGSGDSRFSAAAEWYLALTYLKMNQEAQARALLVDLAGRDSIFQNQAEQLLKMLKEE